MFKKTSLFFLVSLTLFAATVFAGKVELTTYYPAPYGEYKEIKASNNLSVPVKPVGTPADPGAILKPGEIWVEGPCPTGTWDNSTGKCA